jgi:iron(II)-dependent oxidoreductase
VALVSLDATTSTRDHLAHELGRARERTLGLVDGLDDATLRAQISPLMSPLVWDLAHIANYEELWLLRAIDGRAPIDPGLDDLYDAFEHPRWERPSLPILGPSEARAYLADVRGQVLDLLADLDVDHGAERLWGDGFVHRMVAQHEHQHDETLLATLQLRGDAAVAPPLLGGSPRPVGDDLTIVGSGFGDDAMVRIDGGRFVMGTSTDRWALDNERDAHEVEVGPFQIDATAVTNRAYRAFVASGGYDDERVWSSSGWQWRVAEQADHPLFWRPEGQGAWSVLRFGTRLDLDDLAEEAVQHVCFHEAEAFARWAGKRLPTEAEWEKAAVASGASPHDPGANLGQHRCGPARVGPAGPLVCVGMIGDVWEWTSSDFTPYPGFEPWPYREYSEVFFGGEYKVLRGGSWATDPIVGRTTFRNWDYPIRRQIFAGIRCARDD